MKTEDKIEVMKAYLDGKKIESRAIPHGEWNEFLFEPNWNWENLEYRVLQTKDSIDWSHVAPKFKFMAREENGEVNLFEKEPKLMSCYWSERSLDGDIVEARAFASYKEGTVDWKDSLVKRP